MKISTGVPTHGRMLDRENPDDRRGIDDPVAEEAEHTLENPIAEVVLDVRGNNFSRRVFCARGENITAVVMSRPDQPPQLAAVTFGSVPAIIARVTSLIPPRMQMSRTKASR